MSEHVEIPLWVEALSDDDLFKLNDEMLDESLRQGYYPGKTETAFWKLYSAVVAECTIRNEARGW